MNEREIKDALQRIDPGPVPADLADRAFRRAMASGRAVTFAERFAGAGRRLVLGAAAVAVAVWIGVLVRPADEPAASAAIDGDPVDAALVVWTGEAVEEDLP